MEINYDEQFIIIQAKIGSNNQDSNKKIKKSTEELKKMLAEIIYQINNLESSQTQKDPPKYLSYTTVVSYNRRAPPLEGGQSMKIGGIWTLKHEISSPRFYELLIKIELRGDTAMDLKNFYNHINMCLNVVTILREDFLIGYHSINRHS